MESCYHSTLQGPLDHSSSTRKLTHATVLGKARVQHRVPELSCSERDSDFLEIEVNVEVRSAVEPPVHRTSLTNTMCLE